MKAQTRMSHRRAGHSVQSAFFFCVGGNGGTVITSKGTNNNSHKNNKVLKNYKRMRKVSILKHKIIRAYHNPKNWEYSEFKGYPKGTYFGYASLDDAIKKTIKNFIAYYGKGLKKWRYN